MSFYLGYEKIHFVIITSYSFYYLIRIHHHKDYDHRSTDRIITYKLNKLHLYSLIILFIKNKTNLTQTKTYIEDDCILNKLK